jgi:triosephosphate isomerase
MFMYSRIRLLQIAVSLTVATTLTAAASSSSSSAKIFLAANWKCSIESIQDVDAQCEDLNAMWSSLDEVEKNVIELCINPPFVYIDRVRRQLNTDIQVGSQNALDARAGRIDEIDEKNTGATTMSMLRSVGTKYVLLGHSDRRNNLGETNQLIATKVRAALEEGMGVTLTIGELKWQKKMGLALRTLKKQLSIAIANISPSDEKCWEKIVIAYEPVWAVGEGSTPCSPAEAQRINAALRKFVHDTISPEASRTCRFTYTGSVNDENAPDYASLLDVDGFVVGRAGLDSIKLKSIIKTLVVASIQKSSR